MSYTPNATVTAEPTIGREVRTAAEEFRVLKSAVAVHETRLDDIEVDVIDLQGRTGILETQITAVGLGTDSTALAANLASRTAGKGTALIGEEDAGNFFPSVVTKTANAIFKFIGSWYYGDRINVFEYMTTAQIASVKAYNYSVDVTVAVQAAWDAAYAQNRDVYHPPGGYKIDVASLVLPGVRPTPETRDRAIRIYGQGYGNPFSSQNLGGTVFKSISNRPILTDNPIPTLPDITGAGTGFPTVAPDAQGTVTLDHIRFDGTSGAGVPVVLLNSASGISEYHHFVIFQRGAGDGLYVGYGATAQFHDFYVYNSNFVATGLGAARTGVGVNFPNSYGAGLVTFRKCSSRGWHDCYIIGRDANYAEAIAAGKDVTVFHCTLEQFECSTFFNGVTLGVKTSNCSVLEGYFEGAEDGICIEDKGVFNSIIHNQMFAGFATGIKLSAGAGYGGVCAWNEIATSTRANTTCIDVTYNLGLGRTVSDNIIVWGSSGGTIAGVAGIKVSGLNPQANMFVNMFNPKIAWVGGAGTAQIVDNSTSNFGAGSGVYGFGSASFDTLQVPMLNQGAISLAKGVTAITTAPAGVCTLSMGSVHTVTFPGAATPITAFAAPNLQGKFFILRVTNGNCLLTNGATLKLAGGVNYTPGAAGASITFFYSGTVAEEISRTAY